MEYFKIFIITDKKAFKEYCESRFSYDTSFLLDENKDAEIHLVPYTIPYEMVKRYVSERLEQEYVTYINSNGSWEELTSITFGENDIIDLIESKAIMDYEEYIQWKSINLFLIKDKQKFIKLFDDKLSDIEKITIYNNSKKAGEQLLYLIEIDDEYVDYKEYKLGIKFEHSPVAHIFPKTIFDEDAISKLKENDLVEELECKLHKKYNNISINNSDNYILLTERLSYGSPKVTFFNGRYVARTIIIEEPPYRPRKVQAVGRTKDEAISRLKEKIEELNIIKRQEENEHKNTEESIEDDFADI